MLFNSLEFAVFLPIVFLLYWLAFSKTQNTQNLFLLFASWVFYALWDWKCLSILLALSLISWYVGIMMQKTAYSNRRRIICTFNILFSVAVLILFKYYNFFTNSFSSILGLKNNDSILSNIIIPVGLSFYIFKSISYTIEVYKNKIKPETDVVKFCLYIGFFPHLFAGPIERASNMLPQLSVKRVFSYNQGVEACRQFVWGLFKKVVIADNCAIYVDNVFSCYTSNSSSTLVLAVVLYAFQIYADFSGYSDMAIGIGKLFGIEARKNFDMPYFSRNISEFWRKWHISLTSWFTDYVYIPMGGSKCSTIRVLINTFTVFLLSGLWHGSGWNYVAWGLYHAILFVPIIITSKRRKYNAVVAYGRTLPTLVEASQMISVFLLTLPGWVMFRSTGLKTTIGYLSAICNESIFSIPNLMTRSYYIPLAISIVLMIIVEWAQRGSYATMPYFKNRFLRYSTYIVAIIAILLYSMLNKETNSNFIYMAF